MAIQTEELGSEPLPDSKPKGRQPTKAELAQQVTDLQEQLSRQSRQVEAEEDYPDRESETRASDDWKPPALLDAPPAREGMVQRWVSTSILGEETPHHTIKRFREGWTPRPADTVSKDFPTPTIQHGEYSGMIGVEGSILCEMSFEKVESRRKYFKKKTGEQKQYADQNLEKTATEGGVGINKEHTTKVSFGKKRIAD